MRSMVPGSIGIAASLVMRAVCPPWGIVLRSTLTTWPGNNILGVEGVLVAVSFIFMITHHVLVAGESIVW